MRSSKSSNKSATKLSSKRKTVPRIEPKKRQSEGRNQVVPGQFENKTRPETVEVPSYETEEITDLAPGDLRHFSVIPDSKRNAHIKKPVVVRAGSANNVLAGWHLVEQSVQEERPTITCSVQDVGEACDGTLCLMKMALRKKPPVGNCESEAEGVRDMRVTAEELLKTGKYYLPQWGGNHQRGLNKDTNVGEDNIYEAIGQVLDTGIEYVRKRMSWSEHLDRATMDFLVSKKAGKDFFQKVAANKRAYNIVLHDQGLSYAQKKPLISAAVRKWFQEYTQNNREIAAYVRPTNTNAAANAGRTERNGQQRQEQNSEQNAPEEMPTEEADTTGGSPKKDFKHWTGKADANRTMNVEELNSSVKQVGEVISGFAGKINLDDKITLGQQLVVLNIAISALLDVCDAISEHTHGKDS